MVGSGGWPSVSIPSPQAGGHTPSLKGSILLSQPPERPVPLSLARFQGLGWDIQRLVTLRTVYSHSRPVLRWLLAVVPSYQSQ